MNNHVVIQYLYKFSLTYNVSIHKQGATAITAIKLAGGIFFILLGQRSDLYLSNCLFKELSGIAWDVSKALRRSIHVCTEFDRRD